MENSAAVIMISAVTLLVLVLSIILTILYTGTTSRFMVYLNRLVEGTKKAARSREEAWQHRYKAETAVNRALAAVLHDLAVADKPEILEWKLAQIRQIDRITMSGEITDATPNLRDWLFKALESKRPGGRDAVKQLMKTTIVAYQIMDVDESVKIPEIIEEVFAEYDAYSACLEQAAKDAQEAEDLEEAKLDMIGFGRTDESPVMVEEDEQDDEEKVDFGDSAGRVYSTKPEVTDVLDAPDLEIKIGPPKDKFADLEKMMAG